MKDITPQSTIMTKRQVLDLIPDSQPELGGYKGYKLTHMSTPGDKLESGALSSDQIADASITLAKLSSGVTFAYAVKYAGLVTWSGGLTTLTASVSGVQTGDIIEATFKVKPTQAAYIVKATAGTDQILFELSAANTSNDAVIYYTVFRATS